MLKYFFGIFALVILAVVALAGFRGQKMRHTPIEIFPDMDHQPKYQPQHSSEFFADGRAARPPVSGTVPLGYNMPHAFYATEASNNRTEAQGRGFSAAPDYYSTGRMGEVFGDGFPLPVTDALMARGQERFQINCAICHGATGAGNGIVKQYGMATIVSLQDERIRTMPDGEIFNTITHGKNTMGPYGPTVTVEDRWAIIAYLRALQRSQNSNVNDLSAERRAQLAAASGTEQPAPGGQAQ
jgi:mono/diheme cytochrome c family protein